MEYIAVSRRTVEGDEVTRIPRRLIQVSSVPPLPQYATSDWIWLLERSFWTCREEERRIRIVRIMKRDFAEQQWYGHRRRLTFQANGTTRRWYGGVAWGHCRNCKYATIWILSAVLHYWGLRYIIIPIYRYFYLENASRSFLMFSLVNQIQLEGENSSENWKKLTLIESVYAKLTSGDAIYVRSANLTVRLLSHSLLFPCDRVYGITVLYSTKWPDCNGRYPISCRSSTAEARSSGPPSVAFVSRLGPSGATLYVSKLAQQTRDRFSYVCDVTLIVFALCGLRAVQST